MSHLTPKLTPELARERGLAAGYDDGRIFAAASRHFDVEARGHLGRIPLFVMHRR